MTTILENLPAAMATVGLMLRVYLGAKSEQK